MHFMFFSEQLESPLAKRKLAVQLRKVKRASTGVDAISSILNSLSVDCGLYFILNGRSQASIL